MATLVLLFVAGSPASAQEESLDLEYRADASCPSRDDFLSEIRARTALARFDGGAAGARRLVVDVRIEGERARGRLAVVRGERHGAPRELVADSCSAVVSALALIAALAIDPHASTVPGPELRTAKDAVPNARPIFVPPLPAGVPAASTQPPSSAQPDPRSQEADPRSQEADPRSQAPSEPPLRPRPQSTKPVSSSKVAVARDRSSSPGALVAGARAAASLWPDSVVVTFGGGAVSLEWDALGQRVWSPDARVSVTGAFSPTVQATTGRVRFHLIVGGLDLCPVRLVLSSRSVLRPCVGIEAGEIAAQAMRDATYTHAAPQERIWFTVRQLLRLEYELTGRWRIELEASLAEAPLKYDFYFEPPPEPALIAKMPRVIPSLAGGVAMRFW